MLLSQQQLSYLLDQLDQVSRQLPVLPDIHWLIYRNKDQTGTDNWLTRPSGHSSQRDASAEDMLRFLFPA